MPGRTPLSFYLIGNKNKLMTVVKANLCIG